MTRIAAAFVAIVAAAVLVWATTGASAGTSGPFVSSGVIRVRDGVPYVHENSSHLSANIASVSITGGRLYITFDVANVAVSHVAVEEDETFAQQGFICGGSGGVTGIEVRCNRPVDSVTGSTANLWIRVEGIR